MRIGIIGDIHFGVNENNEQFVNYQINSIEWALSEFIKNDIKHIVFLGDFFDKRRYIVFKTLSLVEKIFSKSEYSHFEYYFLVGNHDCYNKNNNDINSPQLLFKNNNIQIFSEPQEILFDNYPVLFLPWINKENMEESDNIVNKTKSKCVFAHLDLTGFEMTKGINSSHSQISIETLEKFSHVISGHYHLYSNKRNITYLGSLCQQTWNDHEIDKFIGIFETENEEINLLKNPFDFFRMIRIKNNEDIKLFSINDYVGKNVKIYLYIERTIVIEKFIESIIEVASIVNVIDEQIISTTLINDIETSNMSIIELWKQFIETSEFDDKSKKGINKLFIETYNKVNNGE